MICKMKVEEVPISLLVNYMGMSATFFVVFK